MLLPSEFEQVLFLPLHRVRYNEVSDHMDEFMFLVQQ